MSRKRLNREFLKAVTSFTCACATVIFSVFMLPQQVLAQNNCSQQQMQVRVIHDWSVSLKATNPPAYIPTYHFPVPSQEHRTVPVDVREVCLDGDQVKTIRPVSVCYDATLSDPDYFANGFCFNQRSVQLKMSLVAVNQSQSYQVASTLWIPSRRLSQVKDQQNQFGDVILIGTEGNFLDQVKSGACLAYRYDLPACK